MTLQESVEKLGLTNASLADAAPCEPGEGAQYSGDVASCHYRLLRPYVHLADAHARDVSIFCYAFIWNGEQLAAVFAGTAAPLPAVF